MGQVIKLITTTQSHVPVNPEQPEDSAETSTPTLSAPALMMLFQTAEQRRGSLDPVTYWDAVRESDLSELLSQQRREPLAKSGVSMVPLATVGKCSSALVLVTCLLSLTVWATTGFALINPYFSILTTAASIIFLAMSLVLELKEKNS